jgi:hypothetical protein
MTRRRVESFVGTNGVRRDPREPSAPAPIYLYAWGNNARRAELNGRECVIVARGALGSVLIQFRDTGERVVTARRALRKASP